MIKRLSGKNFIITGERFFVPRVDQTLPGGETVDLICVGRGSHPYLQYLHQVRRGNATEANCTTYRNMRLTYTRQLAEFVATAVPDADAVITPPSSRDDAKPYRDAILGRLGSPIDLSERLSRTGNVKAADVNTTVEMLVQDFTYCRTGDEATIESLVIVDETFGTGKTVEAILAVLRANGLRDPEDCKVTVATALKVE